MTDAALDVLLETARLWLAPLRRGLVRMRLDEDEFATALPLTPAPRLVQFPVDWPGELLPLFEHWAEALESDEAWTGQWVMVGRGTKTAIGCIGLKSVPVGEPELGYGVIEAAQGIGLATEALVAVSDLLLAQADVEAVVAESAEKNAASGRVLAKAGFEQSGTRVDDHDGPLLLWRRTAERG